jgi:hypothetical protein
MGSGRTIASKVEVEKRPLAVATLGDCRASILQCGGLHCVLIVASWCIDVGLLGPVCGIPLSWCVLSIHLSAVLAVSVPYDRRFHPAPRKAHQQGFAGVRAGAAMAAVLPSSVPPSPPAKVRLGSRDDGSPNIFRLCAQPGCGKNFAVRAAPTRLSVGLPDFDGSYRSCSVKCENMLRVTERRAAVDYRPARESRQGDAEEDDCDSDDDPLPRHVRRAIKGAMSKGLSKAAKKVAAPLVLTAAYAVTVALPGGGAFSATDVIISGSKPPPSEAVAAAFRNVLTVAASMPAKLAREAVAFRSSSAGRARRGTAAAGPAAAAGAIAAPLEHHSLAAQVVAEASRFADADVAALAETFARERVLRAAAAATVASVADEDEVAALKKAHPGLFLRPVEGLRATQRAIAKAVNDAKGGVAAVRKLVDRAVALAERLAQPKKYAAAEAGRVNAFRYAAKARGELREAADWAEESLDALVGREELLKSWKARREDVEDALVAGLELVKELVAYTDAVRLRLEGPLADMEKAKAKPLPSAAAKVGGRKRQRTGGEEGEGEGEEEEEAAGEEMQAAGEEVESGEEEESGDEEENGEDSDTYLDKKVRAEEPRPLCSFSPSHHIHIRSSQTRCSLRRLVKRGRHGLSNIR